jgi:hypothetical protein
MGNIYAGAKCVCLWLGEASVLKPCLGLIRTLGRYASYNETQIRLIRYHILDNPYWSRAWITQELGLARQIAVIGTGEVMPFSTLLRAMSSHHFMLAESSPMALFTGVSRLKEGMPLLRLLSQFRTMQCSIRQDRIYSLLALCVEPNRFTVDYDLPTVDLLYLILKHCEANFCFCTVALLVDVLGLLDTDRPEDHVPGRYPYIEFSADCHVADANSEHELILLQSCAELNGVANWHGRLDDQGKRILVPREAEPPKRWPTSSSQDSLVAEDVFDTTSRQPLADGYELQTGPQKSDWSVRMPLLVWARWVQMPVSLCERGEALFADNGRPMGLRVGYTDGAGKVDVRVGAALPKLGWSGLKKAMEYEWSDRDRHSCAIDDEGWIHDSSDDSIGE